MIFSKILNSTKILILTRGLSKRGPPNFDEPNVGLPIFRKRYGQTWDALEMLKPSTWMKYKETLPVVAICIFVCFAVPAQCYFSFVTRPEVNFDRKNEVPSEERNYDLSKPKPRKILTFNQKYEVNEELIEALKYREEYKKLEK